MSAHFSHAVKTKLKDKHGVTTKEVDECLENRTKGLLKDEREDHLTDPVTLWFVAETNHRRVLKVAFMMIQGKVHIKTAYVANAEEIRIYNYYA